MSSGWACSKGEDVPRGVDIGVHEFVTVGADEAVAGDAACLIEGLALAAYDRGVLWIDDDERRSVPLALVLQHGPDRPRRDFKECPVLVGPFLGRRSGSLDRPAAALRQLLDLQVLDDDHAVVLGDGRGCLVRRVPPATGSLACNLASLRFAFSRFFEPFVRRAMTRWAFSNCRRSAGAVRGIAVGLAQQHGE
jgi:hypothetical protein